MEEVEFLDPGPWQQPAPDPTVAPRRPAGQVRSLLAAAPALFWLAAAGLALMAPFATVYRIAVHGDDFALGSHTDGWGRVHVSESAGAAEHEARYGIVEYIAAGVLLLAAGAALVAFARRRSTGADAGSTGGGPGLRLAAVGAGIAGVSLLAGVLASALLDVDSRIDALSAELGFVSNGSASVVSPDPLPLTHGLGAMVWLTVAAVGCGVVAVALSVLDAVRAPAAQPERAPGPPVAAAGAPPAPPPPPSEFPHPVDEVLQPGPWRAAPPRT